MRIIPFLLVILLLIGCTNSKISDNESASVDTVTLDADTVSATDLKIDLPEVKQQIEQNRKKLPEVTGNFGDFKRFVESQSPHDWYTITAVKDYLDVFLTKANEQDKDSTYFYFRNTYYTAINEQSSSLYTNYPVTMKMLDEEDAKPEVQRFKEFIGLFGAELFSTEGEFYLDARSDYFLTVFDGKVSESLNEYLIYRKQEMEEGFSEDAGLLINFDQVYERVVTWERFIETYPDAIITGNARYYFASYLSTLLSGMDNSPVFDYEKETLDFEVQKLYEKVIREGASVKSTEIIKGYYELLAKNEFKHSPELDSYLKAHELYSMSGMQPDLR